MRRIIARTLKTLGVPDDKFTILATIGTATGVLISDIELSMSFFKELNKAADRCRFTYMVNAHLHECLLINFFRR